MKERENSISNNDNSNSSEIQKTHDKNSLNNSNSILEAQNENSTSDLSSSLEAQNQNSTSSSSLIQENLDENSPETISQTSNDSEEEKKEEDLTLPSETPKFSEKNTPAQQKKELPEYKLTNIKGMEYIHETKIQIFGPKSEGTTAGFIIKDSKKTGMFKLGKFVAVNPQSVLDKTKKIYNNQGIHTTVIDEYLAMDISKILGLPTSKVELALIEATKNQILATSQLHIDYAKQIEKYNKDKHKNNLQPPVTPKPGLAKVKINQNEIEKFPILKIEFNTDLIDLKEAVAGSDYIINHGNYTPVCEGNNSNQILGHDNATFNIFSFLAGDPDIIGKNYQNKKLQGTKLFIFDTGIDIDFRLTIRNDGHFYNEYYIENTRRLYINDLRYKDSSFRNLTITDDVSLIEMIVAVNHFFESKQHIQILDKLNSRIVELKTTQDFPQKQQFINRAEKIKLTIKLRIEYLNKFIHSYRKIYQRDSKLAESLIALEELLSPSTIYSKAGIPLRHPQIPYESHFFCFEEQKFVNKGMVNIPIPDEKYKKLVMKVLLDTDMEAVLEENSQGKFLKCTEDDFKKYFTPDRVRLITHIETVPLASALKHIKHPNYLEGFLKLISFLPKESWSISILNSKSVPDLRVKLENLYHYYINNNNKDNLESYIQSLNSLDQMISFINTQIKISVEGKSLYETRDLDPSKNFDKLVELRAKIVKQQQYILYKSFNDEFKKHTNLSLTTLFAKADFLDISHSVNGLLITALQHPEILKNDSFIIIITQIDSIKEPVTDFIKFKETAQFIRSLIIKNLKSSTLVTPKTRNTLPLETTESKISLDNKLTNSIKARSKENIFAQNKNSGQQSSTNPKASTNSELFMLP